MTDGFEQEHVRARALSAERLADQLAPDDVVWLETHLAWCAPCRAIAAEYEAQRLELRAHRLETPAPPRDLWARTSAALEIEAARRQRFRGSRGSEPRVRARTTAPLGPLAAVLVIAVLIGSSAVGGRLLGGPTASNTSAATPLAVGGQPVEVARSLPGGNVELVSGEIEQVCPLDGKPDCTTAELDEIHHTLDVDVQPDSVLSSKAGDEFVIIGRDKQGNSVVLVAAPEAVPAAAAVRSPAVASAAAAGTRSPTAVIRASATPTLAVASTRPTQPTASPTASLALGPSVSQAPSLSPSPTVAILPAGSGAAIASIAPTLSPGLSPSPSASETVASTVAPSLSASPTPTPAPSVAASGNATTTEVASATPTAGATDLPSASAGASASPDGTAAAATSPSASTSATPSASASAPPAGSATPTASPTPAASAGSAATTSAVASAPLDSHTLAIAKNVAVASGAQYSPDGHWFAFTARPSDGHQGPDVYVWRAGDQTARPITTDHASVFADWVGNRLLVSRVAGHSAAGGATPASVLIDPATSASEPIDADSMWRPTVHPNGRTAVWWSGTVEAAPDPAGWRPATGQLVVDNWPAGSTQGSGRTRAQVLVAEPIRGWDARWDETGAHLAVWVAGRSDATRGTLSLYNVNPESGVVDRAHPLLDRAPALDGFSIAQGRIAWVAPEGDAFRVKVLAWSDRGVGTVQTLPQKAPLVVH
ncbi:MAG: hypothetical protein ACJ77N_01645 [Chloroflexota bacterium]